MTKTKRIAYLGLFAALTFVCTRLIQIPLPQENYFHFGDTVIFIAASLFGWGFGGISGGIGSMLADLLSPYAVWVPYTFVIKLVMGALIGIACYKQELKSLRTVFLLLIAGICMVGGYYLANKIIYTNEPIALLTILFNVLQYVVSVFLGLLLLPYIKRILNTHK